MDVCCREEGEEEEEDEYTEPLEAASLDTVNAIIYMLDKYTDRCPTPIEFMEKTLPGMSLSRREKYVVGKMFLRVAHVEPFLDLVSTMYFCHRKRRCTVDVNTVKMMLYLVLLHLNSRTWTVVKSTLIFLHPVKACDVLTYLTNKRAPGRLKRLGCGAFDVEFVEKHILGPLEGKDSLVKKLHEDIAEYLKEEKQKKYEFKPTVPVAPKFHTWHKSQNAVPRTPAPSLENDESSSPESSELTSQSEMQQGSESKLFSLEEEMLPAAPMDIQRKRTEKSLQKEGTGQSSKSAIVTIQKDVIRESKRTTQQSIRTSRDDNRQANKRSTLVTEDTRRNPTSVSKSTDKSSDKLEDEQDTEELSQSESTSTPDSTSDRTSRAKGNRQVSQPKAAAPVKSTATTVLREAARLMRDEQKQIEKLESLAAGAGNFSQYEQLEVQLRERKEQEELEAVERKHLQGLLSREEAVLARQALLEQRRERMHAFLQERQEWEKRLEELRAVEVEKIRALVEKSHRITEGARNKQREVQEKKHENAQEILREKRARLDQALKAKEEELARRIDLIRELRLLQGMRRLRVKEVDFAEPPGLGLLCEMSIAELKERLLIVRTELHEQLQERRARAKKVREEKLRMVADTRDYVEQQRLIRRQSEKPAPHPARVREESEQLQQLRRRLQEARQQRAGKSSNSL